MPKQSAVLRFQCKTKRQESGIWISHCPALGIYSQGESENEANEAIHEAVTLYLQTAYKMQTLDRVIRAAAEFPEYFQVDAQVSNEVPVEVPLTLLAAQANASNSAHSA